MQPCLLIISADTVISRVSRRRRSSADSRMDVGALLLAQVRREHQLRCAIGIAALAEPCEQRQQVMLIGLNAAAAYSERRRCLVASAPAHRLLRQQRQSAWWRDAQVVSCCQQKRTRTMRRPGTSPPLMASTMLPNRSSAWDHRDGAVNALCSHASMVALHCICMIWMTAASSVDHDRSTPSTPHRTCIMRAQPENDPQMHIHHRRQAAFASGYYGSTCGIRLFKKLVVCQQPQLHACRLLGILLRDFSVASALGSTPASATTTASAASSGHDESRVTVINLCRRNCNLEPRLVALRMSCSSLPKVTVARRMWRHSQTLCTCTLQRCTPRPCFLL